MGHPANLLLIDSISPPRRLRLLITIKLQLLIEDHTGRFPELNNRIETTPVYDTTERLETLGLLFHDLAEKLLS